MNRIQRMLAGRGRRKLLVPFFTAGYPTLDSSLEFVRIAADCGADIIEIGIPFSDPLADGPQIQYSSAVALRNEISLPKILAGVEHLRKSVFTPIVLMGYYNPVWAFGEAQFLRAAGAAGVDGLIIPDLPVEEASEYCRAVRANRLSALFLVAPTSSPWRVRLIERASTDLVYAVTVTGVTGARASFNRETDSYLRRLRAALSKPFVAGFGVSGPDSAKRLCRYGDGVVIGSALVHAIRTARNRRAAAADVSRLLRALRKELDR